MSRNEEIKAKAVEIQEDHYDGYYSGHIESYQQTAIDAATWADEMEGESGLTDEFIDGFKKAMEE